MQPMNVLFATSIFTLGALAKTITVEVGNGGLNYNPATITAAMGDMVKFEFYPQNHSVVQADYANPCMPMSGGIFSGFVPTANGEASEHFTITINNTNPIWLYCAQDHHCEYGMVGVINPPSGSGMTLKKFMSAASSVSKSVAPTGGVMGGVLSSSSMTSVSMSASNMAASKTATSTMSATISTSPATLTGAASSLSADKLGGAFGVAMAGLACLL